MRVPKFRALDRLTGKMFPVGIIDYSIQSVYIEEPNGMYCERDFDEVELMQPTGLKDVHGTEIYEGDIINYKYGRHTSTQFVVKYDEFQATFVVVDNHNDLVYTFRELADYIQLNSLEVIGNIYENKELLEEEVKDD